MVFHTPHKKLIHPTLFIANVNIDCVNEFNFLNIIIHKYFTNMIASKISSKIDILNKLKHYFSPNILEMIYNSLILSRIYYGTLLWGYNHKRIGILRKKLLE